MESKRAKELAEAHWNGYVGPLTEILLVNKQYTRDEVMDMCQFYYTSSHIHGFKHGVEDQRNGLFRPRIGHHPPAHPYYHKDELPLSSEEVKAINDAVSHPSLCGTCIRQGCPVDCAEHTTECVNYLAPKEEATGVEKAEFSFSFPAAEKFMGKPPLEYLAKLREEVKEVGEAMSDEDYIVELMDVIHVAETAIRNHVRNHGIDIQDLADHTVAKNKARGYYDTF